MNDRALNERTKPLPDDDDAGEVLQDIGSHFKRRLMKKWEGQDLGEAQEVEGWTLGNAGVNGEFF